MADFAHSLPFSLPVSAWRETLSRLWLHLNAPAARTALLAAVGGLTDHMLVDIGIDPHQLPSASSSLAASNRLGQTFPSYWVGPVRD